MVDVVRPCVVIPTYDNPRTIADVVGRVRAHVPDVIVVDDGSGPENREQLAALAATGAIQVDADGQHDTDDVPKLLAAALARPEALVLAAPRFDASAPRSRLIGRRITIFWTDLEAGRGVIEDPMCGFRVYPLASATAVRVVGRRMDFDIEIAVRMVWAGVAVVNLPTAVRYVPVADGGVSHFRLFGDNLRISWMHTRLMHVLVFRRMFGWLGRWWRRRRS